MWVECSKRLPEKRGEYKVIRRGMRGRPHFEDWCFFIPKNWRGEPAWMNSRNQMITTVEWWQEEADEA